MISSVVRNRGRLVAILAVIIAWTILIAGEILPDMSRVTQGFASYYAASYAVLHGGAADLNDDEKFPPWVTRSGVDGIHEVFAGNVPTLSLLMIPLTAFRPEIAQTFWLILDVGLLVCCAWLAGKECALHNPTARWWIAAGFAVLASVGETIRYGQVYLLLAFLSLIGFTALQKHRDIPGGIAVAGMLLLKPYYGVLCLALLVWSRRPRSIIVATATALMIVIGSWSLLAVAWPGFLLALANTSAKPWISIPAEQTLNSLTAHLFQYSASWNTEPLLDAPLLAAGLHYGLLILLVAVTLWQARKHEPLWLWPSVLILMPILSPVAEVYHYTILLLPVAVGITYLVEQQIDLLRKGVVAVALLLLIVPWWPSLHSQVGWGGWNGLLAYPRLVGGLLLWGGLIVGQKPFYNAKI